MIFEFAGMAGAFAALRHSKHDGKHCQSSTRNGFVLVLACRGEAQRRRVLEKAKNNLLPFRGGVNV
jgi:hypothetical protein